MITHPEIWERAEARLQARRRLTYAQARCLFNALYDEAKALHVFPSRDRLHGLQATLRLAAALHRLPRS